MPTVDGGFDGQEVNVPIGREKGEIADQTESGAIRRERLCEWCTIVSGKFTKALNCGWSFGG